MTDNCFAPVMVAARRPRFAAFDEHRLMMHFQEMSLRRVGLGLILAAVFSTAWAQYKVIGADGRVTYTDRPPTAEAAAKISSLKGGQARPEPAPISSALPLDLRQTMKRQPVTLYTGEDCAPCEAARQWLAKRGIPFTERRVASADDIRAFEQLGAGRILPGLGIGAKQLRGLNTEEWSAYLDAAGYPKESRLPAGWRPTPALPMAPTTLTAGPADKPASASQ